MRNRNDDARNSSDTDNAHWLHGHHQGENADRGNYTVDTNFNRDRGDNSYSQYGDPGSFNSNADQRQMSPQGRFQAGGARYSGENYARSSHSSNLYGMTFTPNGAYNSGRHYDPQADYSNQNYDDLRRQVQSHYRYGMADERFGHEVRHGKDDGRWARDSRSDYESYRRNEQGNPDYDNDYTTGFAGRNYAPGETHYGEGSYYSNLDRWNHEQSNQRRGRPDHVDRNRNR